jgi:hypothetical protein
MGDQTKQNEMIGLCKAFSNVYKKCIKRTARLSRGKRIPEKLSPNNETSLSERRCEDLDEMVLP